MAGLRTLAEPFVALVFQTAVTREKSPSPPIEGVDSCGEVLSGRVARLEKQTVGVLSRFVVGNDMDAEIKQAFILRPHIVDNAAGFLRMDVLSPEDMPKEIWLMTYWVDIESYRTWHKSHAYHESHAGIPKGLRLVPGSAALRIFKLIVS